MYIFDTSLCLRLAKKIMLYCIALHCFVLYCIVLYCVVLYFVVLCYVVLCCIVLSDALKFSLSPFHSLGDPENV